MKLKLLAQEIKATAEEHLLRPPSGPVAEACRRQMIVDHHPLEFARTFTCPADPIAASA